MKGLGYEEILEVFNCYFVVLDYAVKHDFDEL